MKAISTYFNGRRYRSRLEARWAAFFELLGWHAEYEPFDFSGWIPDFVLSESETIYIEVKPVNQFPEEVANNIDRSGCDKEVLIVGMTVPLNDRLIGWLREDVKDSLGNIGCGISSWSWGGAVLGIWKGTEIDQTQGHFPNGNPNDIIGFCHKEQSFRDRITGFSDGGCYGQGNFDLARIRGLWAQAGNLVQWKKPQ